MDSSETVWTINDQFGLIGTYLGIYGQDSKHFDPKQSMWAKSNAFGSVWTH